VLTAKGNNNFCVSNSSKGERRRAARVTVPTAYVTQGYCVIKIYIQLEE